MKQILLLATGNIRKTKRQTVILLLLFLISSMTLNVGLIVLFDFGSFFDRTAEELNTSETFFNMPASAFTNEVHRYFDEVSTEFQANNAIMTAMTIDWRGEPRSLFFVICDLDEPRSLTQWKSVGDALTESADSIYLPYIFKADGGHELGDRIHIDIHDTTYHFTISGFVEYVYVDTMFLPMTVFIPESRYQQLTAELYEYKRTLIFANGIENYARVETALLDITGLDSIAMGIDETNILISTDYTQTRANRISMAATMSMMMVIFTAVIAAVCLLVIRFRISNSIEEDMQKIGSLQSIGYTSRQITLSVAIQYTAIALSAALVGVITAYLLLPAVGEVFAVQSGLFWRPGIQLGLNLLAVVALTIGVAAVSWIAALKIRKISPVQALRGGIATHSFKRNPIALDKSKMPLTIALSFKSILQGMRQSITVFIILTAVSFTATVAAVLYYNSAIDLSAFEQVPGIERSNVTIFFIPGQDNDALKNEVVEHEDVRLAQFLDHSRVTVDGIDSGVIVMEHYNDRVTENVFVGVFPRFSNEIAISGLVAGMLNKNIGDEVSLGNYNLPYLITGLTQGMESGGPVTVYLTLDGMLALDPDFTQFQLRVYLRSGTDNPAFIAEMEELFGDRIFQIDDDDLGFAVGVSAFASIVSLVGAVILITAGLIIILVLYFVISSLIIRKRREFGIQKAIGYTTMNLMNQITLSLTFPIILGAIAGSFLAALTINPIMSVGMTQMGVIRANYIINISWVATAGLCIIALSYLSSILITWRIRKISAYTLVTE